MKHKMDIAPAIPDFHVKDLRVALEDMGYAWDGVRHTRDSTGSHQSIDFSMSAKQAHEAHILEDLKHEAQSND